MSRRLLTSTQVAEILSEPEATTRRRTRQGIYDDFALNLGTDQRPRWRYDQARLERWLDQHLPSSRTLPARGRGAGLPGRTA